MDKPLYNDGIEVHSSTLQEGPDAAEFHIQRRTVDMSRSGRASGLDISIGTPNTRFDVTPGFGYTPRGDYVELVVSNDLANFALADYTNDVENLVVLAYREVDDNREAHEDGGSTRNTIATRSSELKVLTRSQFNALPVSADADLATNLSLDNSATLAVDVQDRMLIVASVFGKGFSGGAPIGYSGAQATEDADATGDFAGGLILQQLDPQRILAAGLSALPLAAVTIVDTPNGDIKGINIKHVSSDTNLGLGQLWLFGALAPGSLRLRWMSPNTLGTSVSPTGVGGVVFSPSPLPQTFVVNSETSGETTKTITVEVITDLLPITGYPFADQVVVSAFYEDYGPIFSASDELHRLKLGSYTPTPEDPHGTGYPDLAQHIAIIPKPLVLGTDELADSASAEMARITTPRSTAVGVARTLEWNLTAGDYNIRFYKNTSDEMEIVTNARWSDDGVVWIKDDSSDIATRVLFAHHGMGQQVYTGGLSSFPDSDFVQSWASAGFNVSSPKMGMMNLGTGFLNTADLDNPRVNAIYADTQRTLLWSSPSTLPLANGTVRFFAKAFSVIGATFEVAVNASWNPNTSVWSQDVSTQTSSLFSFYSNGFATWGKVAGSPSWTDSQWEPKSSISGTSGSGQFAGTVFAGLQNLTNNDLTRFEADVTIGGDTTARHLIETVSMGLTKWRKYVASFSNSYTGDQGFFIEEVVNARWDTGSSTWLFDDLTREAILFRSGSTGSKSLRHTGANGWADTDVGWSSNGAEYILAPDGGVSRIYDGTLRFISGPHTNPIVGTGVVPNSVVALNASKAWAVIRLNSTSGTAGTANLSIVDGYNIASVSDVTDGLGLQVIRADFTVTGQMASADYGVEAMMLKDNPNTGSHDEAIAMFRPTLRNTAYFYLAPFIWDQGQRKSISGPTGLFDTGDTPPPFDLFVSVYGRQS